jgi:gliding motility-associated-like protein
MRLRSIVLLTALLLLLHAVANSQACTGLGQTPASAFPVCGNTVFTQSSVTLCSGTDLPGPCGGGLADANPYWYKFTCFNGGTLGFTIVPFNVSSDYDWQLFDITGRNPADVFTVQSLFVACNWSGLMGTTGASPAGTSLVNCAGNFPIFSSMPTLIAGHQYLLMVSHFTATQSGYQLTFAGGTAVITDATAPLLRDAVPNCDGTRIGLRFNKRLKCSSLAANGSDFTISPGGIIVSAAGFGCANGFDFDSLTLALSAPLPPGNYTITSALGTDGNTLLDNCDVSLTTGQTATFTILPVTPLPMGTVGTLACAPTSITLNFPEPVNCNSLAVNGSDFIITGPSAVTVNGVGYTCNAAGETSTVTLQLTGPITTDGTYQVEIATGSDGNTVIGQCSRSIPAGSQTPFTIRPQVPIAMGTIAAVACAPQSVTLTFAENILCNSIHISDFIVTGPSAVTVVSTTTSCTANETTSITLNFAAPITVSGNYQVQMAVGVDGNTVLGNCARQVTAGDVAPFTIAAQTPVPMGTVNNVGCAPTTLVLTFAEPINCVSLAPNGSDFTITGPSGVTVIAANAACNVSPTVTSVTLTLSGPVTVPGNYNVVAATGSDGNTITGSCLRTVTAGDVAPFTIAAQTPVAMGTISNVTCAPTSVVLTFAENINCNSLAANGSDFTVTGPSAVTITGATATCNGSGETTAITLTFAAPITVPGNYNVVAATGSDGNTITGSCLRTVSVGDVAPFTIAAQTPVAMGTISNVPCAPSSVLLLFSEGINCNSVAANGSDFVVTGPSPVTVTGVTTACNASGQTIGITVAFAAPITVPGNYTVVAATGSDGNTLSGNCLRTVTAGDVAPFTVQPQLPVPMGTINASSCMPTSVVLTFPEPVLCSSIAPNGSDFTVTGPSAVTVISASPTCNAAAEVTEITITFAAPVTVPGTYNVVVATGNDGNTIIATCLRSVTVGDAAPFTIAQRPPLPMGTINNISCSPSSVTITFPEDFLCASVAADGSDFTITGPTPVTIISATALHCSPAPTRDIVLQFASPINLDGNYQVQVNTGSDGNTIVGACARFVTPGSIASFPVPAAPAATMSNIAAVACSPTSIRINLNGSVQCSSIAANGSDFTITGPSAVTISSAAGVCTNGLTSTIDLQLASPIVVGGGYTLQLNTGTDGNTLLSDCYRASAAGATINFTASDTVSARFTYTIQSTCTTNDISLTNPGGNGINSWAWTVNGNAAGNQSTLTQSVPATSTTTVQLTVSNGVCSDTRSQTIQLNNEVVAEFTALPLSICPEDSITLDNNSRGPISSWQWNFGNSQTSAARDPLPVHYPQTGVENNYTITLTVSDANGCQDVATATVKVFATCIIAVPTAFTPNGDGRNDYFYPLNAFKADNLDFKVFNRWGQVVFQSADWTRKWDGTIKGVPQASDIYVWTLRYKDRTTGLLYNLRGTTMLIR